MQAKMLALPLPNGKRMFVGPRLSFAAKKLGACSDEEPSLWRRGRRKNGFSRCL